MTWPFPDRHQPSSNSSPSSSSGEKLDADEPLDVHSWGDKETHIRVTNPEGFAVKVEAHARVDLPHDEVFAILTAPDNHEVFSSIVAIPYRKVLRNNDFLSRREVAVDHDGRWKLGPFRGKIRTKLLVEEDGRARTVRFTLRDDDEGRHKGETKKNKANKGSLGGTSFMSRFEGGWRVAPLSQSALDAALRVKKNPFEAAATSLRDAAEASPLLRALRGGGGTGGSSSAAASSSSSSSTSSSTSSSLISLDQALAPSFAPPPPFDRMLFAAIAGKQVRVLIEDLRKEAERRKKLGGGGGGGGGGGAVSTSSSTPSSPPPKKRVPSFPPLLW